jgi:hypothetical protein
MSNNLLNPQPTEENPIIKDNYPYGFNQRTKIRYWIETDKKKGDRFISQTLNPKTNVWNKPKKSTYSEIIILGENEEGHIIRALDFSAYDNKEENDKKVEQLKEVGLKLNKDQENKISFLNAIYKTREHVTVTINEELSGVFSCDEIASNSERWQEHLKKEQEHEKQQEEVKKDINKIFNYYLKKEVYK